MPTALVTGGSRGIGRAICLRLARDGHDIVAVARDAAALETLGAEIDSLGRAYRAVAVDLTDPAATARALAGVDADVLVNNAGVGVMRPFVELAPEEWHRMIALNIDALFHVTRAVLPGMLARRHGHVCSLGSISGRSAFVGGSGYAASKAFVTAWSESLLLETRDHGVKVSVVMPGAVATGFGGRPSTEADAWKLTPQDVADAVAQVIATPPRVLIHRLEVRTLDAPPARR